MLRLKEPSWFNPHEVVWLSPPWLRQREDKNTRYRKVIERGAPILLREVTGYLDPTSPPRTRADYDKLVSTTERQFELLGKCGLRAADTEFYIHQEGITDPIRLIACTTIIAGSVLTMAQSQERQRAVDLYRGLGEPFQLDELGASQCLYGHPRTESGPDAVTYIDIEPRHRAAPVQIRPLE